MFLQAGVTGDPLQLHEYRGTARAQGITEGTHAARRRVVAAAEKLVLDFLRSVVADERALQPVTIGGVKLEARIRTGAEPRAAVTAAICVTNPGNSLVVEDGGFCAGEDRQLRIKLLPRNYRRLARFFAALDAVHRLNSSGRSATLREFFYRAAAEGDGSLFGDQTVMNHAIGDVVGALRIGRPHLGVFTAEKGLVAGALTFQHRGYSGSSNIAHGAAGVAISEAMLSSDDNSIDVGAAHCVLVLEKDSFFQHLLQGRLMSILPLILITGRGYPDMLTRRFLQRLQRTAPRLPQIYLGDYDPHGVAIFLMYRVSCPQLHWLGMHEADVSLFPVEAAVPFTKRDHALRASLLRRPEVVENPSYAYQVRSMKRKFELEALHAVHGPEEIALRIVPEKILRRSWL